MKCFGSVDFPPEDLEPHVIHIECRSLTFLGDKELKIIFGETERLELLRGIPELKGMSVCLGDKALECMHALEQGEDDEDLAFLALAASLKQRVNLTQFEGDFKVLRKIPQLDSLSMIGCDDPENIDLLGELQTLQSLSLNHYSPPDLSALGRLKNLTWLSLAENEQYTNIDFLKELDQLEFLDLEDGQFDDLTPVSHLKMLRTLKLTNCNEVDDISPLRGLKSLTELDLRSTSATDLSPLSELVLLRSLRIDGDIDSIEPVSHLKQLEVFAMEYCDSISDFSFLADLVALQDLTLQSTLITDVSPLAALTRLQSLSLRDSPVENIEPLSGLANLKTLDLSGTNVTDLGPLEELDLSGEFFPP